MLETPHLEDEMPRAYEPGEVEQKWYRFWLERGYFQPANSDKEPFVIIMPPPNVTGELHVGHALTAALEDIMVRWRRMKGQPALWLPGVDHAGIAAQVVVEQLLAREGLDRHRLGRHRFLERMRQWAQECRQTIARQHQRLGVSCDWGRERFTLDEGPSRAVRAAFVRLYSKGLIYRGERIINWCPRCATALSDLEVDHKDLTGHLYYVRYPLVDGGFITVATTRPETILGDTAVAVNPGDDRFRDIKGKEAILPEVKRKIPVLADEAVDPAFGTGAVKITPAHDPVDFEVSQRHGLPLINILNPNATMNENAGRYAGMDRFECRRALLADLEREGLLVKVEPYSHAVGHCQRCQTVVEPIASKQWFVKTQPLAEPAIKAVTDGRIRIVPERFTRVYLNWMENIRDWCISRQLWWGHPIPAWYCGRCDGDRIHLKLTQGLYDRHSLPPDIYQYSVLRNLPPDHEEILDNIEWASIEQAASPIVSEEQPGGCPRCGGNDLIPDPDVLDTWFSSALWPHSTLGWPDDTNDFRRFYPTSVMETGYDILFFWVARMIMMGLEDTGEIPFHTVYLHGLVRDEKGDKMSKVRGNVLNPIALLEQYGTDALRFALSTGTSPGNDLKLMPAKLEAGRNFANKLWNAARFVIRSAQAGEIALPERSSLALEDRWILSRLNRTIAGAASLMEDFQFGEAQRLVHDFLWGEFCDWYIELAKVRLRAGASSPAPVLAHVLEASLRLLHPFMPFVTEELWQNLKDRLGWPSGDSIMVAAYPRADSSAFDPDAEKVIETIIEVIRAVRNVRAQYRVENARWVEAQVYAGDFTPALVPYLEAIESLARARPVTFLADHAQTTSREDAAVTVLKEAEVVVPLASLFDVEAEKKRLQKEMDEAQAEIARLQARLGDDAFLTRAPAHVVDKERQKLGVLTNKLERLRQQILKF